MTCATVLELASAPLTNTPPWSFLIVIVRSGNDNEQNDHGSYMLKPEFLKMM